MGRKDSAESRFLGTCGLSLLLLQDSRTISIHATHGYDVIHVCCLKSICYIALYLFLGKEGDTFRCVRFWGRRKGYS